MMNNQIEEMLSGIPQEHLQECRKELETILNSGLEGNSLIKKMYTQWKSGKTGTDNQLNSLTGYLLKITSKKPDGPFKFVKRRAFARPEPPDIDSDFEYEKRPIVIDYIRNKYGRENVCNIGVMGALKFKTAIDRLTKVLDCGNFYGKLKNSEIYAANVPVAMEIKKSLPPQRGATLKVTVEENGKQVEKTIATIPDAYKWCPDFRRYIDKYPDILKHAHNLEGLLQIYGVHASGVVISDIPLRKIAPLRFKPGDTSILATQFTQNDLNLLGLIKFDILGISTLSVISRAIKLVKEINDITIDLDALPLDDKKTLDLYKTGKLMGVFQCESRGMQNTCKEIGVDRFEDILAAIALYRPGPAKSIPEYCDRKHGRKEVEYFHPSIEKIVKPILSPTYGVLCYQESVMQICNALAGFTIGEGYVVIKGISKKKQEIIDKAKPQFIKGCAANGVPENVANNYWDQFITPFASYGFNKSLLEHTLIKTPQGEKKLKDFVKGDEVYAVDVSGEIVKTKVLNLHDHGVLEGYEVTFDDGTSVVCSVNHKFLTQFGQQPLWKIWRNRLSVYGTHEKGVLYEKNRMENQVWNFNSQQKKNAGTPERMSNLHRFSLAEETLRNDCCSSIEMWNSFKNPSEIECSSKGMFQMLFDKTGKYQDKDGKIEQIQSISAHKSNFISISKSDFSKTRNSKNKKRKIKKMERRKSREICKMYRSSMEKSQEFKNGDLVKKQFKMEVSENSLWYISKTSGFSQKENMDRSGRVLSFFPIKKQKYQKNTSKSSIFGSSFKFRSSKKKRYNVNKIRNGLFCELFGRIEARMDEDSTHYAKISSTGNLVSRKIIRILPVGKKRMFDLEVACSTHNFLLSNGIVTSNSHSAVYGLNSYYTAYLKANFPEEFMVSLLNVCAQDRYFEKKKESDPPSCKELEAELSKMDMTLLPKNINKCELEYKIIRKKDILNGVPKSEILPALACPDLPEKAAINIVANRPYADLKDLAMKTDPCVNAKAVEALYNAKFFHNDPKFKMKKEKMLTDFNLFREDAKIINKSGRESRNIFDEF
jgi:hypothetical protein